jgi:4-amino-4-deoxy-L-arabinose transferase-like glycosyltransferase
MRLFAAEKFVVLISSTLFVLDGLLLAYKGVGIDIIGYAVALAIGFFSLGLGQFYRSYRENEGIALATLFSRLSHLCLTIYYSQITAP